MLNKPKPSGTRASSGGSSGSMFKAGAVLVLASALATAAIDVIPISPNADPNQANPISDVLTPSFAGFSIEPSNVFAYTGAYEPNPLTHQLMLNLNNLTGQPPHFRIGGNTGDQMVWNASATKPEVIDNPTSDNKTYQWFIGPGFIDALDYLPPGTPVTLNVNLAYLGADAIELNVQEAHAALTQPRNISIASFEIGNEPDRYVEMGYRPKGYRENPGYGAEWLARVQAINSQVLAKFNLSKTAFEPGTAAAPLSSYGSWFNVYWLEYDGDGPSNDNGRYILAFNEHDYFFTCGVTQGQLMTQDWLLNLNNTYDQFSGWTKEVGTAVSKGKPYMLREVASVGPDGAWGISDSFANTLWTFNFLLYAATVNVANLNFHMTQTGSQAPWQPIPIDGHGGPHVRSPFYAFAAIHQIVGGACNVRIASAQPSGQWSARHAAYTIYSNDQLNGFALINSVQHNASDAQSFANFSMTLPQLANKQLFLSYLSAPGTDSLDNTTWNGISYDRATGVPGPAPPLKSDWPEVLTTDGNGAVAIPVPDGSAVVAQIGSRLGSNPNINASACASHVAKIQHVSPSSKVLASASAALFASAAVAMVLM